MAQFVEALRGMGDACRALDFPIVSGNVSLYNESKATGGGSAILPTPAIGGVGLLDDWSKSATIAFKAEGEDILLLSGKSFGRDGRDLGQSLWLREIHGQRAGAPPYVDLEIERRNGEFVRDLIAAGFVTAVHDISDGGLLVALTEMALAGGIGAEVQTFGDAARDAFSEDQGRYVVTVSANDNRVQQLAKDAGVTCDWIGKTSGDRLIWRGEQEQVEADIPLADLRAAHEGFFPALMQGELYG
jgi:phosphoribosylformylglycinamidine synthase